MDAKTWREAARQLREEADRLLGEGLLVEQRPLMSMARRFENEAKAAEKAIEHGRALLLKIGGTCEESWAQSDKPYEHAAELADALARLVGYPEYDDESCRTCYRDTVPAVEQACAVPATAVVTPEPTGGGEGKAQAAPAVEAWVSDGTIPDEGRLLAFWWGSARPEIGVRRGYVVLFADCAVDVMSLKAWFYLPAWPPPPKESR